MCYGWLVICLRCHKFFNSVIYSRKQNEYSLIVSPITIQVCVKGMSAFIEQIPSVGTPPKNKDANYSYFLSPIGLHAMHFVYLSLLDVYRIVA